MSPQQERQQQVILWFAMLAAAGMYAVVVRMVAPTTATENPAIVTGLLIASLALVAASFGLKSHFLRRGRDLGNPAFRRMAFIIAIVFCEAAALCGVVTWFLTGSTRSYWMIAIGAAGIAMHFPARES